MPTAETLSMGLRAQILPILGVCVCLLLAYLILKWVASSRHRTLAQERGAVTESSFARDLEADGFDPVIARSTFRYLQEVQGVRFPPLASDDLDVDLGLDFDDIHQTLVDLTGALNRDLSPGLLHKPLVTVEDLIRVLQACPRRQAAESAA